MTRARLVVCEPTDRWTIAMRRLLDEGEIRVFQSRSLADCERHLSQSPASLVLVDMQDLTSLAKWLLVINEVFPDSRVIVAIPGRARRARPLLRELGVVSIVDATRELHTLVPTIRRHFELHPQDDGVDDPIWANLPWPEAGASDDSQSS